MKKFILSISFVVLYINLTAQCAFNNTFFLDATPPSCPGTMNIGCMLPGEYVTVNVVAGNTYTFTTCGGTLFTDTELTLYNAAGTTVLDYNDDDCGVQSTINWVATLTGTVNLLLDEFPCSSSGSCVDVEITCTPPVQSGNGCNTDITICTPGVAGPFGFNTPGPPVSSCLDFFGPDYAYIVLYITSSGPLELLIDGDAATGFLDVAIFDVPSGQDPCLAINNVGNEIGCNYADFSDGCNQFGTSFPCGSSVPSPNVSAGDVLMIVVENWSGSSTNFTMELAPPPAAQTGPPDPTINPVATVCSTDPSFQVTAVNMGGDWSGPGISTAGVFNPGTAGIGIHNINYVIGQPPCQASSSTTIEVIDCSAPCSITNLTANVGACVIGLNTYSTTGQIAFVNPPATGQLIVEDCNGVQQIFNAPFVSPINYTLSNQSANGAACDITAFFSNDLACTQTIPYVAPICLCNIDNFTANLGACLSNNTFEITGIVEYSSPPAGGTLVIEVDNGSGTFTTIINPPFTSPDNYAITGIPADGSNFTITAFFSNDLGCNSVINSTAPPSCACNVDIGTFSTSITGSSVNNYVLCYGDQIDINSNLDFIAPAEQFAPPGPPYDPGVSWLIYSCPPSVALVPNTSTDITDDPCLLGVLSDFNLSDINDLSMINAFPPGTFTNNTIYYVPITMYSMVDGTYSYVNTTMPCYELGSPFAVQYLPEFNFVIVEDCNNGTATVTVSGGQPEIDGSNFTASNLLPVTASFVNNTAPNNGNFVISNLNGGDNYSFTVSDGNGCPYLISGGPFPPLQDPSFSYPATSYCSSEAPANPIITGVPGGTFSFTPAGLTINPVTGQITPATSTPGNYTITYTTPGPCADNTTFDISISSTPSVDPIVDQSVCEGDMFSAINFTGSPGTTFNWSNDNTNIGLGAAGIGSIPAFSGIGTIVGGTNEIANISVTPTAGSCVGTIETFVLIVNPLPLIDAGADQQVCEGDPVTLSATGAGIGGLYVWDNGVFDGVAFNPTNTATYNVTGTDINGCENTDDVEVLVNPAPVVNAGPDQTLCDGDQTVLIGSGALVYLWDNGVTDGVSFTPLATTTYTLTGTGAGGCTGTDQVTVTVNSLPLVDAGPDQIICIGDPVTLMATGAGVGGVYVWDNGVTDGVAFNPVTTTVYTVTGTNSGLCSNTDQVTVTVNPLDDPSFNYPLGLTYCQTSTDPSANVLGLNGGTFSFTLVSGGPFLDLNVTSGFIDLSNSDIGTYTITYNTFGAPGSLCAQTSSLNLTITNAPVADFNFDIYCANDGDPSPTFINGGSGGIFSSSPVGLSINPATGLVDLSSSTAGTYTITNTVNIAGCALASFDDDIIIHELPDATISGSTSICPGQPNPDVTITVNSGSANWDITYNFNGVPTTVSAINSPYIITGANAGSYDLVSITDGNGCSNNIAGNATISLFNTPMMSPINNLSICENQNLLTPVFNADIAGSSFSWTNITGIDIGFGISGNGNIPIFFAQNGTGNDITVTVEVIPTSPQGCTGLPSYFDITIHANPIVSFLADTLSGCAPFEVNFTNTSSILGTNCIWTFGNGPQVFGCGNVETAFLAGIYDVTLEVTSINGCYGSATVNDYITVFDNPTADFVLSPQIMDIGNTEVVFTNESINADEYIWDFGDTSGISNSINPEHTYPPTPNNYVITLIATNNNGICRDTAQQSIIVQDVIIFYVPNVFTPDHDEFNEGFHPVFTSGFDPFDYHLTIFNRWGEIVFESYNADVGWDGTYSNQGLVQDGVYVWQIEFKETMSDKRHTYRGHVTVLK